MILGDTLARLAEGKVLSAAEIGSMRLELNKVQAASKLLDADGSLGMNVLNDYFSVLPHECALLYNGTAQSIPNNEWTTPATDSTNPATTADGLEIDTDNSRIYVTGIAYESWILFVSWASFVPHATGERALSWNADDSSVRYKYYDSRGAGEFDTVYAELVHLRPLPTDQTYYFPQVFQDSGGALNLSSFGFAVVRIR